MESSEGFREREVGKLTDDDLKVIDGKRERLVGKIQEKYGITKENAEDQVAMWTVPDARVEEMPKRKAS